MQAKKNLFLKQLLAVFILGIFSLAITPWGALHHHEVSEPVHEKHCTHSFHVKSSSETCLICKAHFEKHYSTDFTNYSVVLTETEVLKASPLAVFTFTEVIASCLRGPPIFS
jgi:hypothetical protein